jgi:Flp pilus assembly protein TadD
MERKEPIYVKPQQSSVGKNGKNLNRLNIIEKADSGDYEGAINDCNEMIRLNPNDAKSYFARATFKVRLGDIDGARKDFKMSALCRGKGNTSFENYPLV